MDSGNRARLRNKLLTIVVGCCFAPLATATSITASQTYNQTLDSTSYSSSIDATSQLAAAGYSSPYSITGGTVTFSFTDNTGDQTGTGYTAGTTAYTLNTTDGNYYNYNYYGPGYNAPESAAATVGSLTANGATSYYDNSGITATVYDGGTSQSYTYPCGSFGQTCTGYETVGPYYYTYQYNEDWGYGGSFDITMALDSNAINSLSTTGALPFNLDITNSLVFDSASLSLTAVPLPTTLSLFTSGFCVMVFGLVRRRRS